MSVASRRAEILRRRDTLADLMEEVAPYVGMSPEQRDLRIQQTARLAAQMILDHADPDRTRNRQDPLPESSRRIWRRLMEQYRHGRTPR